MKKEIRDGKVAVLLSRKSGWYTAHGIKDLIFDANIVRMVLNPDEDEFTDSIIAYCKDKYGSQQDYAGADSLRISWIPRGSGFVIHDSGNGFERVEFDHERYFLVA